MTTLAREIHWYEKLPHKEQKQSKHETTDEIPEFRRGKKDGITRVEIHAEKYTQELSIWLKSIANKLRVDNREDIALQALRGVLHSLRDRLIPDEVFNLSAQLPTLIRGIYFEGYSLGGKPEKLNLDRLLRRIEEHLSENSPVDSKNAFKAVLKELHAHISRGELQNIYDNMPQDIKNFWNATILQQ